ncbi:hemerythrin domain-containing protein [Streptomyces sp. Go-475]|uniref:hemerythrin domain-containing protein n=1 Tax=Streptomyces sp. Go-475 TaxID=2072505 RepID=UPI000DF06BF7|nr:hemerythrin domain-containing protein [Streptomyces sp. Go-475]AXE83847.1 DNA nickase [Streptomyces sp. Go-475]
MTDAMPHMDDAGENDDVVTLLTQQHHRIRNLFAEVENATGGDRAEAFRGLVRLLAVHETAEEEVVHPAARRFLEDGEQVVDDRLEEERAAKEKLSRLDDMDPDDPGFMPAFRELRAEVLQHAASEEQYEFPRLREKAGAQQLSMMATAVRAAEAMAPTHPHPGVETAAQNIAVGPMAAVIDRTRDAVRKAMGGKDG